MCFCKLYVGNFCQTSAYSCILKEWQSFVSSPANFCHLLLSFVGYFAIFPKQTKEKFKLSCRYYNHDKSWQQSYTCWLVSTFWSIGYFLYFLALIIQVCQVFAQRYLSVDSYYKIISSRLFAFYVFVIVVISLIPIVLPLSSFNTLKVYVTYIGPICNPFMDLISEKMITPGKTYAAVVFIGAPAAALGMNMLFGLVYLVKVCRRLRRTPLPDPAPRKTRWSSVATVVIGQVYGLIMGPIGKYS